MEPQIKITCSFKKKRVQSTRAPLLVFHKTESEKHPFHQPQKQTAHQKQSRANDCYLFNQNSTTLPNSNRAEEVKISGAFLCVPDRKSHETLFVTSDWDIEGLIDSIFGILPFECIPGYLHTRLNFLTVLYIVSPDQNGFQSTSEIDQRLVKSTLPKAAIISDIEGPRFSIYTVHRSEDLILLNTRQAIGCVSDPFLVVHLVSLTPSRPDKATSVSSDWSL